MSHGKARFNLQGKGKVKAPKPAVALPQTPQQLEQLLCALLAPDNEAIQSATVVITAFLKVPTSLSALIQQIAQSAVPQARQMAAVLLRREILKLWKGMKQPAEREQVKAVLLKQLFDEPDRGVRHSIGALISQLAKELVPKNLWNELLQQLLQLCQHPNESHREIAMMLFTALAENLTKSLKKHFKTLQGIFTQGLSDPSVKVRVEALKALLTLVDMLDIEEDSEEDKDLIQTFSTVIDPLLSLMAAHFHEDDILCAGFDVLENLAESPTNVLDNFIPKIAELMARISVNTQNESGTREKAAKLLEDLIKHKVHKLLRPQNLIPALLEVSYALVVEPFEEDDTDATPQKWGIEILDAILLNIHIAKKDVFAGVLAKAGELVQSQNQEHRKGGFVILAIMADGCGQLLID